MQEGTRKSYYDIEIDIRARLSRGEWGFGDKLPPSRTLAQEYGSSVNTVEKALKQIESIGLVRRVPRVGTIASARVERPAPSGLVAVCVLSIDNPLWTNALRGAEDRLRDAGYSMISISHDHDNSRFIGAIDNLAHIPMSGIIVAPIDHDEESRVLFPRAINDMLARGSKVVFMDNYLHAINVPYVTTDNVSAAYRLTKMLIDKGHQKIGFVRVNHVSTIENRFSGFRQACYDSGIPKECAPDFIIHTRNEDFRDEFDDFHARFAQYLHDYPVTAVFAGNDQIGKAILYSLDKQGKSVPDDISMVTYDTDNLLTATARRITGVRQNFYEMGHLSAEMMLRDMTTNSAEHNRQFGHIVPSEIITFDSIKQR